MRKFLFSLPFLPPFFYNNNIKKMIKHSLSEAIENCLIKLKLIELL